MTAGHFDGNLPPGVLSSALSKGCAMAASPLSPPPQAPDLVHGSLRATTAGVGADQPPPNETTSRSPVQDTSIAVNY